MSNTVGTFPPGSPSPVKIPITRPAANAEWTITVPNNTRWEILSIYAECDLDATTSARRLAIRVTDGTDNLFQSQPGSASTASTQMVLVHAPGMTVGNPVPDQLPGTAPLPIGLTVRAGYVISSVTLNLQAGDRYDNVAMLVMESIDVSD